MPSTTHKAAGTLLALSLLLSGCGKDFLDVSPTNSVTDENFYQNETDAIQAVNAAYAELSRGGQYNYALWGIGDIMSDNSTTGGGGGGDGIEEQQLDFFNIPASNPMTTRLWNGCYVGIGRANLVLARVPGIVNMRADIRKRCLGEAQFLRAKYYFDLVRAYGDVPLIITPPTKTEDSQAPRTPADQVYAQIITDLKAAADALDDAYSGDDLGRATKWAAKGLLAKVYLTQGNLPEAAAQARAVIAGSGKSLWADYGDNFKLANENGKESLFEVQYINGKNEYIFDGLGFVGNEFFGPRGQKLTPQGGYGFNVPEQEFVQGYENGDKRRDVTIWKPGDVYPAGSATDAQPASLQGSPFGYNCKKWFVGKTNTRVWDSPLNFPVLRLAEVYLILAEAAGPTVGPDGGLEAINKVRRRAFGLPIDAPSTRDLTVNTPNFKQAVIRERRYELAFEDDRWFDLKRTGDLLTLPALQAKGVKSFNLLLPIPQTERDANPNLTQNPGY
ncbi:Starch-binding associating with outer membrane [Hymenobacter daecheongensis DSM 21074]|uniref:Starch-binding associating with outer membrane n=1 Tax=Hymenobacter daecheongensis DSM 21074 TaxID=1121955 RepID=A0A1M6G7D7_9BACT|nr:RagB/SusD family nutrient uptake outer membrane protein [Hymenobacter daecheongensis]SHJ05814.1 Starch-binding associating with outer membrane [Hymenobacter daecheongensis DSM 21074]